MVRYTVAKKPEYELTNHVVVGIDPAATRVAFVAIRGEEFHLQAVPKLGPSGHVACCSARTATLEFLDSLPWSIAHEEVHTFIEDPVLGRGGFRSTMVQAFTSGAIQGALHEWGATVHRANVSTWKKQAVGKGNAKKPEVAESLRLRWPALFASMGGDQDLCDAASIALYGHIVVG